MDALSRMQRTRASRVPHFCATLPKLRPEMDVVALVALVIAVIRIMPPIKNEFHITSRDEHPRCSTTSDRRVPVSVSISVSSTTTAHQPTTLSHHSIQLHILIPPRERPTGRP